MDHQPPTANRHQPPSANRQLRPTANRQPLLTAIYHQSPTTNRRQPPPTASRHPRTTTAHRQDMLCPRAFLGKLCNGTPFFISFRTALEGVGGWVGGSPRGIPRPVYCRGTSGQGCIKSRVHVPIEVIHTAHPSASMRPSLCFCIAESITRWCLLSVPLSCCAGIVRGGGAI